MKNFNTTLILLGILSSSILIIENMVIPTQSYVYIWITRGWILAIVAIFTGILIGYGLRGKFSEENTSNEDEFNF